MGQGEARTKALRPKGRIPRTEGPRGGVLVIGFYLYLYQQGAGKREALSSPSGVWGRVPAEIKFVHSSHGYRYYLLTMILALKSSI